MTFFLVAFHKLCEFAGLYVPPKIPAVLEVHPILYTMYTDCIPQLWFRISWFQDPLMNLRYFKCIPNEHTYMYRYYRYKHSLHTHTHVCLHCVCNPSWRERSLPPGSERFWKPHLNLHGHATCKIAWTSMFHSCAPSTKKLSPLSLHQGAF